MTTTKVAIVQAGSLVYDTQGTLQKLVSYCARAASDGAKLVLFPEAFIGGYPKSLDFGLKLGMRSPEGRAEFKRYYDSAIEYEGPEATEMAECARQNGIYLVTGVVERDGGTLYCSVFFFGPDGSKLGKHRKVMPTALERCTWGFGDGSTLPVLSTAVGRIGAAICWENYMPLLRMAYYNKGIQIYLAPTVDDRENWLSTMRTIALEGRCFVLSACQFLTGTHFPAGHALHSADPNPPVIIRGGSCAVGPLGDVLLAPDFNAPCEGIHLLELDIGQIAAAKFDLDIAGHYARPDIFRLLVDESEQKAVTSEQHKREKGKGDSLTPTECQKLMRQFTRQD